MEKTDIIKDIEYNKSTVIQDDKGKEYVIVKKTKFMAVLDFIVTMAELTIFATLAVGLLCIAL